MCTHLSAGSEQGKECLTEVGERADVHRQWEEELEELTTSAGTAKDTQ